MRFGLLVFSSVQFCLVPPALAQQVRDSAGIRITRNSQPMLPAARMWRVAPQPFLQIGKADADTVYEFLRIMGVARLSDGRIAVANGGSNTVRFFDSTGKYLSAAGRSGEGPGEFLQILSFRAIRGDSLAVGDVRRVNYYSPQGNFARATTALTLGRPWIYVRSFFADGSYLGGMGWGGRTEPRAGRWIDSMPLYHVGPGAAQVDSLGRFPWFLAVYSETGRSKRDVVFGPKLHAATSADAIYLGFPDRYEIRVYTPAGALQRIIRRNAPARPTPTAVIEEYRRRYANQPGEDGRPMAGAMLERFKRFAAELQFVEELPPFSKLQVDRTDHLWVQQYETWEDAPDRWGPVAIYTDPRPTTWDVFNPDGGWLGRLTLPGSFAPLEIGADYVAGLWRDADDVEYVRFYRLLKP